MTGFGGIVEIRIGKVCSSKICGSETNYYGDFSGHTGLRGPTRHLCELLF